jgi:NADPH-dependent glutamate synthase beta subunit-like oxidoreductase/ferredoxin
MRPTDITNPKYYHRVVDCQWACPAHTNVPEYIRLIAQGRFSDSYWLNRESNVFPGILGRTCDRPCEPACRRTRVDGKPVAICRLKRVAADLRDTTDDRLPSIPKRKNGKRIALIGAGPASLTVCNDLMPLGYECTIFEQLARPGGLMRINIPAFRLPAEVLDEEIDMILDMGVEVRYETPVTSLAALLDEGWDTVFIGSGAPKGKELKIPGREEGTDNIHIGIEWLANVHFGHIDSIGERVLVIGVGNTAMDCCRTAKRLGGKDVKVMAIGQDNAFPWIERDIGIEFNEWDMPVVDRVTFQTTREGVFVGGDAAWGPENIIWAVEHGHQAAISIHNRCQGIPLEERPPEGMNLISAKMGMHAWSYHNDYNPAPRQQMIHVDLAERFRELAIEVETGFTPEQTAREVQRCLNCDIQTHFTASLCIECDACIDVCPLNCLTITPKGPEAELRTRLSAPAENLEQSLYVSAELPQTSRVMIKDEDLCIHCGLCAERCPTAAWDMRSFEVLLPYAGHEAGHPYYRPEEIQAAVPAVAAGGGA